MGDLISRQEAIEYIYGWVKLNKYYHPYSNGKTIPVDEAVAELSRVPAADVPDRKVGKWEAYHRYVNTNQKHTGVDDNGDTHTITEHIYMEYDWLRCPFCKAQASSYFQDYCPHCGARMEDNNA